MSIVWVWSQNQPQTINYSINTSQNLREHWINSEFSCFDSSLSQIKQKVGIIDGHHVPVCLK